MESDKTDQPVNLQDTIPHLVSIEYGQLDPETGETAVIARHSDGFVCLDFRKIEKTPNRDEGKTVDPDELIGF
jgi:hypothetical protein